VWELGLNWSHIITVKGRAEATDTMVCLSGKNKPPGEYPPFFIDPFKRKDKEDVNRRLARLRSQSNGIHDREDGEGDEEEHEDFYEEDGEEDWDGRYRIRHQNLILAWIDPWRCHQQNKQRKE
jgi:hypothetical protein